MSATTSPTPAATPPVSPGPAVSPPRRRPKRVRRGIILTLAILAVRGVVPWSGLRIYSTLTASKEVVIPTAKVQRGDVSLAVTARGEINGGNPETLTAPLTGGSDMHITMLRTTGEEVKE